MSTKRSLWQIVLVTLLIVCLSVPATWLFFLYTPVIQNEQGVKYRVVPGASIKSVANDLHNRGLIRFPQLFILLARWHGNTADLKAGEYLFLKGAVPSKLLEQMFSGSGMVYHAFTIIPGTTFQQLRSDLKKNENLKHSTPDLKDAELMLRLGSTNPQPEGQFYPDTYYFVSGSSDLIVLKKAYRAMQKKLKHAWDERDKSIPFKNTNEALIAASIIEKEAYQHEELPIIAGVMINRIRQDMLLQFDPTVIYGLGERYDGVIHKTDLADDNPYNTYIRKGLPPTPISMPSLGAIQAVMHPKKHDYLYFVARGDGTHQFSKSWAEHDIATKEIKNILPGFFNTTLVKNNLLKVLIEKMYLGM